MKREYSLVTTDGDDVMTEGIERQERGMSFNNYVPAVYSSW